MSEQDSDAIAIIVAKHGLTIDKLREAKKIVIELNNQTKLASASRSLGIAIDRINESIMWLEKGCQELIAF